MRPSCVPAPHFAGLPALRAGLPALRPRCRTPYSVCSVHAVTRAPTPRPTLNDVDGDPSVSENTLALRAPSTSRTLAKPSRLPTPLLPYACPVTPVELSRTVLRAVRRAVDEGELSVVVPVRAVVTPPGPGGCGDYATNIALQLARPAGRPARQVAEILRPHLTRSEGVADVAITGPGFLNIRLGGGAGASLVREIQRRRDAYGHGDILAGQIVPLRIPYDIRAEV